MLFTDLVELKSHLGIDPNNTNEDKVLNYWIEQVSDWFEELLNRKFVYKSRTEYYSGTGTTRLCLKARPVFVSTLPRVWVNRAGYYGSVSGAFSDTNELTYGDDFYMELDQEGVSSRSGILHRRNSFWEKTNVRQTGYLSPYVAATPGSIKVTYTAGYTIDSLPSNFRLAANLLIARLRSVMPLGIETSSESYEERSIAVITSQKQKLLALVAPMLYPYRNWSW